MVVNWRKLANSQTKAVNPNFAATLYTSSGFTTVNFQQVPSYVQTPVMAEVQALTWGDVRRLEAINIQGAEKSIYLDGAAFGVNRLKTRGGDLIVFPPNTLPEGDSWLVLSNLEQWQSATWCRVAVVSQDLPPA